MVVDVVGLGALQQQLWVLLYSQMCMAACYDTWYLSQAKTAFRMCTDTQVHTRTHGGSTTRWL